MSESRVYPQSKSEAHVAIVAALRAASSMLEIEAALAEATGPGDVWPQSQSDDFPNPAFVLAMVALLERCPAHARYAVHRLSLALANPHH